MNVENATSDDSMNIDEDLVAALGFEPATDILIVDDALNDDLSISSDDIQVSTKEAAVQAKKSTSVSEPQAKGAPPTKKSNKTKGAAKNKAKAKPPRPVSRSNQSNLVDRLEADSASAAETEAPEAKPDVDSDKAGFAVAPPPPTADNAVLLSEPSPSTYGFSDVKLPDIKGALARFTRSNGSSTTEAGSEEAISNGVAAETLTSETASATATPTEADESASAPVIEARVAESPPKLGEPLVTGPVTAPPTISPDPGIQIIETPAEPNVYRAPTRTGRTRIRSRKVRRQIRHIDPWSVLTFSVIFHACVFGAMFLASVLVWRFADGAGLIENAESFWAELADKPDFEIDQSVLIRAVAMIAGLLTIASSVLMVLLTVFFNLISDIVGGIRVTVIEEEPVRIAKPAQPNN